MRLWIGSIGALSLLVGCGDTGSGTADERCTVTNETINETQWVMWEALPGGQYRENAMARMKFFEEDGTQKVSYTVKSPGDVYVYVCEDQRGKGNEIKEWFCKEESHIRDWCQALEVHQEGLCSSSKLQELGAEGTPKEFEDAIKEGRETVAKYRGTPNWAQFRLNNNNLGNKLQGFLYVKMKKVRAKAADQRCQLSVTDMYMTLYDGRRVEDSNPVGTNPFIQTKEPFEFEHCTDPTALFDYSSATLPEDKTTIPARRLHELEQTVYYHYIGQKDAKATEGCAYSVDTYAQWKPISTGQEVTVAADGLIQWNMSYAWTDLNSLKVVNDQNPTGVMKMVRYKTCADGKKEKIDVLCNPSFIVAPPEEAAAE